MTGVALSPEGKLLTLGERNAVAHARLMAEG